MTLPDHDAPDPPSVIKITRDEANSPHVNDLLKRQMSLRGEQGIARDRQSRWYLKNWFIFMIVGGLFALLAWAIIEPYFDDFIYVQGPITETDVFVPFEFREKFPELYGVRVNNKTVFIPQEAKVINGTAPVSPAQLGQGAIVGFYVEWLHEDIAFADGVKLNPPPGENTDPSQTLDSLSARSQAASLLFFPLVAAMVGLGLGATDGIVCRVLRRALLAGTIGLLVGFIGGFISSFIAGLAYAPLNALAMRQAGDSVGGFTTFGFVIQMAARSLAWGLAGVAMGLGQGLALRSGRLIFYGLLGGVLGGVLGGLLFDPIHFLLIGNHAISANWSRLVGLVVVGATVGAMIGIVELLARDAWLCMTRGPLAGKEFLVFKDTMRMGSSPKSDIYLFNDPQVEAQHAVLRSVGDVYELESLSKVSRVSVNGRPVNRTRLRHGDQITLGDTLFTFNCKKHT